jgi:hypothetical protein
MEYSGGAVAGGANGPTRPKLTRARRKIKRKYRSGFRTPGECLSSSFSLLFSSTAPPHAPPPSAKAQCLEGLAWPTAMRFSGQRPATHQPRPTAWESVSSLMPSPEGAARWRGRPWSRPFRAGSSLICHNPGRWPGLMSFRPLAWRLPTFDATQSLQALGFSRRLKIRDRRGIKLRLDPNTGGMMLARPSAPMRNGFRAR